MLITLLSMIEHNRVEEVRIESEDGLALAGTFVDPGDASAAVLILTGSGRLDRDSNSRAFKGQINPAIAGALAARGIASLRYDKRGAGESGGDFFQASLSDNHADAVAAAGWLGSRVEGRPVFGVGHSEGALHVARLAADELVAGAVLIACAARRGEEILTWQAAQIVPTLPRATRAILRILRIDPLQSQQKAFVRVRAGSAASVRIQGKKLNACWLREFMDYEATPIFRRIRRPVLVIVPEHDMQVPLEDGTAICKLVPGPCEEVIVPGLSHILRDDPDSKGPTGYKKALKGPVSPIVLETIADWVKRQLSLRLADGSVEARQR
jgi:uncharacterized protein